MTSYYKVLTASGRSIWAGRLRLRRPRGRASVGKRVRYPLPKNGEPGKWIEVPGAGAFVMRMNGELPFLRRTKDKVILARLECRGVVPRKKPQQGRRRTRGVFVPRGNRLFREVRVMEIVPLDSLPASSGWRCEFAELPSLSRKARARLVLGISPELAADRLQAAMRVRGLTRDERWELVANLPPDPGMRCHAALYVPGLSSAQRALLVKVLNWTGKASGFFMGRF